MAETKNPAQRGKAAKMQRKEIKIAFPLRHCLFAPLR
jgi:hypothetical protein